MLEIIGIVFAFLIIIFCLGVIFGEIKFNTDEDVKKFWREAWEEAKRKKESK